MNHALIFTAPMLYTGALTFRRERVDMYEALIDKLDPANRSNAAVETLTQIFRAWAERDRSRHDTRALVYGHVSARLANSASLAEALKPFIGVDEYLIIHAGEVQGDLVGALKLLVRYIGAGGTMRSAVLAALGQPALGLASLGILSVVVGIFMWPDFLRSIPLKYWPDWTHACIHTQMWLGRHWYWLTLLVLLVAAYYYYLNRWIGRSRALADRIPPWSIYRSLQGSTLIGVLAALISAGKTVREALVSIRSMSSPYMRWHIDRMVRRLDATGDGMAAIRSGPFSRAMMDRIEDAAAGRTFEDTLRHVSANALRLIVRTVQKQADAINLVFLLIVGVLFVYTAAVLVLGMQEATDAFIKAVSGGPIA